jgi:septum site-determining protein MinD
VKLVKRSNSVMPKIVTVHACRHGLGASNLTANLAVMLAAQKTRVGVLDPDYPVSGLSTLFGCETPLPAAVSTLWFDVLGKARLQGSSDGQPEDWQRPNQRRSGIGLTRCPQGSLAFAKQIKQRWAPDSLTESFHVFAQQQRFSTVLIDSRPVMTEDSLFTLALSDVVLLVMGLETYDFQRVAVLLDVTQQLGVPQVLLVPSLVLPQTDPDALRHQLMTAYGHAVAGLLPFCEELVGLASQDVFCLRYPHHPLTQVVRQIMQCLANPPQVPQTALNQARPQALTGAHVRERTLFGLLDLPTRQRQIVSFLLRQGKVPGQEIAQYLGLPLVEIEADLDQLVAQGWLICQGDPAPTYQPRLSPPSSPSTAKRDGLHWGKLTDWEKPDD